MFAEALTILLEEPYSFFQEGYTSVFQEGDTSVFQEEDTSVSMNVLSQSQSQSQSLSQCLLSVCFWRKKITGKLIRYKFYVLR